MRLLTRSRKRNTTLLMVGALTLAGACTSAKADSSPSQGQVCKAVSGNIADTQKQIDAKIKEAKDKAGTPDEATAKEDLKKLSKAMTDLQNTKKTCDTAAAATTTSTSMKSTTTTTVKPKAPKGAAKSDGDCVVTNQDGTSQVLPSVGGCSPNATVPPIGMTASNADSMTPPVNQNHELLNSWCDLEKRFSAPEFKWYRNGVERTARVTWGEVHVYCTLQRAQNKDTRGIVINGGNPISDADAKVMMAKEGVANADRLSVVRYGSIINTRGLHVHEMNEFTDSRSMVRVSLCPLILDKNQKITGLDCTRGVFVDCTNAWRVPVNVQPPPVNRPTPTAQQPTRRHVPQSAPQCLPPFVPFEGRCVKPASDDGTGGNQSRQSQPVAEHPQPTTPGASTPPPPAVRPPGDQNGGSGDGGATPTGPKDTPHGDDTTNTTTPVCDPFASVAGCP